jgi:peptide/nickel transport system permease protein
MIATPTAATANAPETSLKRFRKVLKRPTVLVGSIVFTIIVLLGVFAPLLAEHGPNALAIRDRLQPPSAEHWLGTDDLGRDIWSRTIYGARLSLIVGLATGQLATLAGTILALVAGYYRWLDEVIMRILDGLMALPGVLLAITIMAAVGPRVENIILALSLVYLPRCARVARSAVLVVREHTYVEAARALGARDRVMMLRHILPGTISPVLVQGTYVFATAILLESSLTFLGVGTPPEIPSWGAMLSEGRLHMRNAPWMTIFPGVVLALTVLSVNLIGDGLRDALDPRMRRS